MPKLAIEGKLTHRVKDKKGRELTIEIIDLHEYDMSTHYRKEALPLRWFRVAMKLRVSSPEGIPHKVDLDGYRIKYDVTGREQKD